MLTHKVIGIHWKGMICLDVRSENITLVTVWSTYCSKEQEKWGDQLEVFTAKQVEMLVAWFMTMSEGGRAVNGF